MRNSQIFLSLVALVAIALILEALLDVYRVIPDATLHSAVSTLIGLLAGALAGYHIGNGG